MQTMKPFIVPGLTFKYHSRSLAMSSVRSPNHSIWNP